MEVVNDFPINSLSLKKKIIEHMIMTDV